MSDALFAIVGMIMRLAPIGAFGAMAFTVGQYGIGSLVSLGQLMAGVYLACLVFIFLGLGPMAMAAGFSIVKFLKYIGEEILIVLGTSSSESVLPRIMAKLEYLGLLEAGGRPGRADRVLVQPRRHGHLHDDGGCVRGAGERRRSHARAGAGHARGAPRHVQGGGGRDRQRLRDAGGDAGRVPDDPGRRASRCCWASTASCPRRAPSRT